MSKLLCIKVGIIKKLDWTTRKIVDMTGVGLVKGEQYTSEGSVIDDSGHLCYQIAELDGDVKLVERFREIEDDSVSALEKDDQMPLQEME